MCWQRLFECACPDGCSEHALPLGRLTAHPTAHAAHAAVPGGFGRPPRQYVGGERAQMGAAGHAQPQQVPPTRRSPLLAVGPLERMHTRLSRQRVRHTWHVAAPGRGLQNQCVCAWPSCWCQRTSHLDDITPTTQTGAAARRPAPHLRSAVHYTDRRPLHRLRVPTEQTRPAPLKDTSNSRS